MRYGDLLFTSHKDSLRSVINMKYLKHLPRDTYRISHYNERLFFTDIRNARRKTIDLIFKVLKPEVKNAFISVIEWPRIPAWYLKKELDKANAQRDEMFKGYLVMIRNGVVKEEDVLTLMSDNTKNEFLKWIESNENG